MPELQDYQIGERPQPPPDSLPERLMSSPSEDASSRESLPEGRMSSHFASVEDSRQKRRRAETKQELLTRLLDPTITLEEAALVLEVCPSTVRRYTNRGILPHERSKGNQRRFKLSTVLAFMEASRSPQCPRDRAGEE
ncbi:MAG: helix-turn-helix domain-containing protein [Capsulimonadaceae bacterium]